VAKGAVATYRTKTTDPKGLPVSYWFDWGDQTSSGWGALVPDDSEIADTHAFVKTGGLLAIKARAKNNKGAVSNWSDTFGVSVVGESAVKWVYQYYDPESEDSVVFFGSVAANGDGGRIIACSDGGYVHFISPSEGRYVLKPYKVNNDEEVTNSPSVSHQGRVLVGSSDPAVYSLQSNGPASGWPVSLGGDVEDLIASDASGNVYVHAGDGNLYFLGPDGSQRFLPQVVSAGSSSPAITSDGALVVVGGGDSMVRAFYTATGTPAWTPFKTGGAIDCSPAIGSNNMIYVGSYDGILRAFKPDGNVGQQLYAANSPITASPVIGPGDTIYFVTDNGVLHAVTSECSPAWTLPLVNCSDPSTAAINSRGVLYLAASFQGGDDSLIAITLADRTRRWGAALSDFSTDPECSPMIDAQGAIYVTNGTGVYCFCGLSGPAQSAWPMFQHDMCRSGRAGGP
jgi:hypothetical protein